MCSSIARKRNLVAGCRRPPALEVVRVTSPDQVVDAVLVTRAVGATVSTPHELSLVLRGEAVAGEPLLKGDRFEELAVRWREPRFLEVRYKKGRVFAFANFWHSERVQAFEYVVELRLRPTVDGFSIN